MLQMICEALIPFVSPPNCPATHRAKLGQVGHADLDGGPARNAGAVFVLSCIIQHSCLLLLSYPSILKALDHTKNG